MKAKDTHLLRETIREILREEQTLRVGDVRQALKYARGKKIDAAAAAVAKKTAEKGALFVLKRIPLLGGALDAIEAGMELKDLYDAAMSVKPEDKKKDPLWDKLTIDPDTSAIVDDGVEAKFVNALGDRVDALDDDDELPDADTQLSGYLKGEFGGAHVSKS
jgi:hypothetical protein